VRAEHPDDPNAANKLMIAAYRKMGDALKATGRPILYSLCQYGVDQPWKWGPELGANMWRTTDDIDDSYGRMIAIGFSQAGLAKYAGPGHWNDPDMLEIGNGGMTDTEYRTHMSLWSMLASPLLAGNDLRTMTPAIHDILTNREVIAIDQDSLGVQATRVWASDDSASVRREIWTRPLAKGGNAVAVFNRGPDSAQVTVDFAKLGIDLRRKTVRDLWEHRNVKMKGTQYVASVPSHGVVMLRVGR
jgi:alpha-galactosidase